MTSGKALSLRLAVLASTLVQFSNAKYTISQNLTGQNFFSAFKFNASDIDFNNFGNVHFVDEATANSSGLTTVNSNGQVIIKVDNTTSGVGNDTFGRNTVYLESTELMQFDSLLIFDVNHIPFGCSVWPSLFTQGQVWPQQGEIDIIENVNLATQNRFSLHVGDDNCNQPTSVASNQTGSISTATGDISNCTVVPSTGTNTVGCVVTENKPNSFGSAFASQGGGVFAMLWDADGIAMWYFPRSNVSELGFSISNENPDPTTWGEASAWYPASGCDPSVAFGPQIITLYTDICGAFAGEATVFAQTCSGNCTSLVPEPSNYDDAYWEINYLQVFNNGTAAATVTSSGSGSSSTGTSGSGSSGTSNSGSSNLALAGIKEFILAPLSFVFLGVFSMF